MAGDEDDWHLREGRVALELLPDLEAAQLRHVNVQQHQVRHRLASKLERQAPRSCETKRSEVTKNIAQDANDGAIVVDQQNAEIFGSLHKVSDRHLRLMGAGGSVGGRLEAAAHLCHSREVLRHKYGSK